MMKLMSAVLAVTMSIPTAIERYPTYSDSSMVAMEEIKKKKKKKKGKKVGKKGKKKKRGFFKKFKGSK